MTDVETTPIHYKWEQHPLGWVDITTNLLWFNVEPKQYNYDDAIKLFSTSNKRLPTKQEWQIAEQHGIRNKFDDFKDAWFWSSSPYGADFAWVFRYGGIGFDIRDDFDSVRCVCSLHEVQFNKELEELMK